MEKKAHTILLVDDEKNILNSLSRLFRREGYGILKAENAAEALALLDDNKVSLVISDYRMPEVDGVEFLSIVKDGSPDTIRFMLTGQADLDSVVEAINKGEVSRYITKPWDDDMLKITVKEALEHYDLTQENRRLFDETMRLNEETARLNEELTDINEHLEEKVRDKTKEIRENFFGFVRMFADLMSLYDPVLGGHTSRVATLARALAVRLGLEEQDVDLIEAAAYLHSIGLIGVPKDVLKRAETTVFLSDVELAFMKKTPIVSQRLLAHIDMLLQSGIIIRSHAENFDGSGYPDGLRGEEIHIGSRILAVCKAYDKVLSKKKDVSKRREFEYIKQLSPKEYDPNVLAALVGLRLGDAAENFYRKSLAEGGSGKRGATKKISAPVVEHETHAGTMPFEALRDGMLLAEDIKNISGKVLVSRGSRLTNVLIEKVLGMKELDQIKAMTTRVYEDD